MSFDSAQRRKATRAGRQRGCSIYIPAEILQAAGVDLEGPTPHYRVWKARRGAVTINLYAGA